MAILSPYDRLLRAGTAGLVALVGLSGCSALLDPDELRPSGGSADVRADAATDATAPEDTAADPGDEPEGRVLLPAGGECRVIYASATLPGACEEECTAGGWELEFDATGLEASSYRWEFRVTNDYKVTPSEASGPKPTVRVQFDHGGAVADCAQQQKAKLVAELGIDGGPLEEQAPVTIDPEQSDGCALETDCPAR